MEVPGIFPKEEMAQRDRSMKKNPSIQVRNQNRIFDPTTSQKK
jgi:hypothetical protein